MAPQQPRSAHQEIREWVWSAGLPEPELTETPLTYAQVADALAPCGWDRATLYRNLMDPTEANLRSARMWGPVSRFELRRVPGQGEHVGAGHSHFCLRRLQRG